MLALIFLSSFLFSLDNAQIVDNSQKSQCGFVNGECAYTVNLVTPGTCSKNEQTTTKPSNGSEIMDTVNKLQTLFVDQSQFLQKMVSVLDSKHSIDVKDMRLKLHDFLSTLKSLQNRVLKNENNLGCLPNCSSYQDNFRNYQNTVLEMKQISSALQVEMNKLRLDNEKLRKTLASEKSARETLQKQVKENWKPIQDSCASWKRFGFQKSGRYFIDADGPGGAAAFYVFCNMSSDPPVAVVNHDKEARGHVTGHEKPTFQVDVKYELPPDQILAILSRSSKCQQYLKWECYDALMWDYRNSQGMFTQYAWWVSRTGQKMAYWGGGPINGTGCACAVTKSCEPSHSNLCNCDKNDNMWREDSGYLTDISTLPASQLFFGDTGSDVEEGYYTLGPLECVSN